MIRSNRAVTVLEVADHYDELDWIYRDVWGEHVHHGLWTTGRESSREAVEALVREVALRAEIGAGDRVCDVGCGYGAAARMIALRHGATVVGVTVSAVQHERAVRRSIPGTSFRLDDWLACDLPDGSFDAVIAIESVEHMTDKALCFRQARRVLRPGGRFVFTTWLAGDGADGWKRTRLLEPICREGRLPAIGSAADYRELLAAEGLALPHFEDLTERVRRTWWLCIVRVAGRLCRDRRYWNYLCSPASRNREFVRTLGRMWLAYETGALRYGLFASVRDALPLQ